MAKNEEKPVQLALNVEEVHAMGAILLPPSIALMQQFFIELFCILEHSAQFHFTPVVLVVFG